MSNAIHEEDALDFLVREFTNGSETAFTRLYDMYSKNIYRNILHLVRDEAIAQELLQDLFLKIWENRTDIKVEGSFKSFLFTVGQNLVYSHFRKVAKDNRLIEKLILSYVDFESNIEDVIISKENRSLLKEAINTLPHQRQQVYTLCKLEGKTYQEVSSELGLSTNTIRNHIVLANKSLKQYLVQNPNFALLVFTAEALNHIK